VFEELDKKEGIHGNIINKPEKLQDDEV